MLHSTASTSSLTPVRFAADPITAPPSRTLAPALSPPQLPHRTSLYQEFAAHQLLRGISALPNNWDGYAAAPIHPYTALNAHRALNALLLTVPVPEITPNTNATVSFEWQSAFGHAHLEIGLSRFSFYLELLPGPTIPLDGDATAVPDILGSVISALLFPAIGAQLTAITSISK